MFVSGPREAPSPSTSPGNVKRGGGPQLYIAIKALALSQPNPYSYHSSTLYIGILDSAMW